MNSLRLAAVAAIAGMLAGCGMSTPTRPAASPSSAPLVQPAQPAQSASPLLAATTQCVLAFLVGVLEAGTTFSDTASGYAAAVSAAGDAGQVHHMAHVTVTNTGGVGFTLNTYAVEVDYQNSPAGYEQLDASTFLAPGESFDRWIYLDESSSFPAMSSSAFQGSTCRVPATS